MRASTRTCPTSARRADVELEFQGPAACPPGSLLGEGKASGIFYMPITHSFEVDRFDHHLDVINNANEQILLIHAEDYAIARGKYLPDGSIEFDSQTCYPEPATGCLDDYILQVHSETSVPVYTNSRGSYMTTPPTCPSTGDWTTTIRFWWADGTTDSVDSKQPCTPTACRPAWHYVAAGTTHSSGRSGLFNPRRSEMNATAPSSSGSQNRITR